ncbi:MAG: hypothetical protein U1E60_08915 [Reyranellaceae bacterium]
MLVYREFPTLNHGFFSYTAISPACAAAADQLCDVFAAAWYLLAKAAEL